MFANVAKVQTLQILKKFQCKHVYYFPQSNETADQGDIEDEMGLTGATAEDAEAEFICMVCETDIVNGKVSFS